MDVDARCGCVLSFPKHGSLMMCCNMRTYVNEVDARGKV